MATTNIELDIENITGVSDANDQFIISAQKFVVSSVPKNLLHFAQKASSASTDGSAISFSVNDSVTDVQRNGYSCKEIPMSEGIWALDSTSLKYATAKHPVWFHKQGAVHFAPVTDGSNAGYVFYVDYSLIDDNSDLRNAVVFHATSSEFTKLGSAELPSISITAVPPDQPSVTEVSMSITGTAPTYTKPTLSLEAAPSIGDLTISVSAPTTPSAPTISGGSVAPITIDALPLAPNYTTPTTTISGIAWATEYPTDEVDIATALSSIVTNVDLANSILDVAPVPPDTPSLTTVSYSGPGGDSDASSPTFTTATLAASSVYTGSAPTYTKPGHPSQVAFSGYTSGLSETDPGAFSISAVTPVQPDIPNFTFSVTTSLPSYTSPTVGSASESLTASMTALTGDGYGTDADFLDFSKWFTTAGEFIEDEEDSELAAVQLNKISTYISAYSQSMQDKLNSFNTDLQKYQAELQKELQEAQYEQQAEHQSSLQQYQAEVGAYSADVNKEVQEYQQKLSLYSNELNMAFQAWSKTESDNISVFQADISNELNEYNKELALYQTAVQESMQEIQVANQVNIAQAQSDLQVAIGNEDRSQQRLLQNAVNEMQEKINDNNSLLQKYQAETSAFSAEINLMTSQSQGYLQTAQGYSSEIQSKMQVTSTKIQEYSSKVQDALNVFNEGNTVYQASVQRSIQQAQINMQDAQKEADLTLQAAIQDYTLELQKFQQDISNYQAVVNDEVQEYQQNLQGDLQVWQAERQTDIQGYASDIQNELNEFNMENIEYQALLQKDLQNAQLQESKEARVLQKYSAEVQSYNSEIQAQVQEYQSKLQKQQAYAVESKKYYDWAQIEISNYIKNNSKMIGLSIASQSQQQAK